jgi:hemoglobin
VAHASAREPRRDITGRQDLYPLLQQFYSRAFEDELLGPVFVDVAKMDLAEHLPVICDFWHTVLFRSGRYRRNAFTPHLALHTRAQLSPAHFERWLAIWTATVNERHAGPRAEQAKRQARRIARSMSRRITGSGSAATRHAPSPQPARAR